MKLGQKISTMYDSKPADMMHPQMSLPSKLFDKSYQVGDKCIIELVGTIESMGKDNYSVKFLEGKEVESTAEAKKEESLLKQAK